MLNLFWLKSFVMLFRSQSFQDAGNALGLAQPTISQHIQKLEEYLGVLLFHRRRLGCEPTREAVRLLPLAESMLILNDRARTAVKSDSLRVGASSNIGIYMLNPYIRSFADGSHQDPVELVIDRNPTVAEKLIRGELDVALMEWWRPQPGFQFRSWKREPLVLIVPPGHLFARRKEIAQHELQTLQLLGGESGTGTGRLLSSYLGKDARLPRVSMQLGSTEAVKQAVKSGLGISLVLASSVKDEVAQGSLCAIPVAPPGLTKELIIIWRDSLAQNSRLPPFVSHLCH